MNIAEMLPQVYGELRRLAAGKLQHERDGHTLDATALVHEAWLKLGGERTFSSKSDFLQAAAQAMRRILVDHARAHRADKRGGQGKRVSLNESHCCFQSPEHLLALEESLGRFSLEEPRKAELVVLRFFAGMTMPEVAETLQISLTTAERWWTYARIWLFADLQEKNPELS